MPLLAFYPPAENERGPEYLEALLGGWLAMSRRGYRLGLVSRQGNLAFLIDAPEHCQRIIAMQLSNAYPGGSYEAYPDALQPVEYSSWFRLSPDVLSLKTYVSFRESATPTLVDPLESLLEVLRTGDSGRIHTELWVDVQPFKEKDAKYLLRQAELILSNLRMRHLKRAFHRHASSSTSVSRWLTWTLTQISKTAKDNLEAFQDKLEQPKFSVTLQFRVRAAKENEKYFRRKQCEVAAALSLLTDPNSTFFVESSSKGNSFQLTAAELATLWHFPTNNVRVPRLERQDFVELEPPPSLNRANTTGSLTLGRVCYRDQHYRFGLDIEARRRHLWLLGKTGTGKTTLLRQIIRQDLGERRGFAVIEPHGDLAESVRDAVPSFRRNDLIYFDPAHARNPVLFNPLAVREGGDKTLVADGVLSAFSKVFGFDESQAPRLLHIFRNSLLSLVEMPSSTLVDVQRLLVEPLYRKTVIARVSNPVVRAFWMDEFGKWKPNDRTAFIASLQNKLGAFLTNEKLQRVLGNPKAKLDLRCVMDEGKVLVVNLSKGRLGENASDLLGTLLVTSLQQAAMTRANIAENERHDFSLIVDEFQNFSTPSIATFLSEARKYRTHLIIANQFMQQIPPEILAAIRGNVGSQVLFQLDYPDAEELAAGSNLDPQHLLNLPAYHAYCRLYSGGTPSRFFSMQTIPL